MVGWGRTTLGARRLVEVVRAAYGVDLTTLEPVDAGADAGARTWRGTDATGAPWAVREAVGGGGAGLAVAAVIDVRGVPAPRRATDGSLSTDVAGVRVSLVPWIEGRSALDVDPTPAQWAELGRVLGRAHATPTATLPAELPRDDHSGAGAAALVAAADTAAAGAHDALGDEAAAAWAACRPRVGRVLEAVRRSGADGGDDLVLCHGDPHRGNVVVADDGRRLWLLDWHDCRLSWRELDLLMVVEGLPGFSTVSAEQLAWFEEGYGPVRTDPRRLAHHRGVRALEDVALFVVDALDAGRSDAERELALRLARANSGADGILALAERSVDDAG